MMGMGSTGRVLRSGFFGLAACLAAGGARADFLDDALRSGGGEVCYSRTYSADHLARHPDQRVTRMSLILTRGASRSEPASFRIFVTVRGDREVWSAGGECRRRGGIVCDVECDGGGFAIGATSTTEALQIALDSPHGRISMNGCDGGERDLAAGRDDRRFRLDRAPGQVCAAIAAATSGN